LFQYIKFDKVIAKIQVALQYRRETALKGALVLAKSGRLKLGNNILWTL